jgi:signal transduction histidine kinase/DNA-binding NarL/FixJ family response regulator
MKELRLLLLEDREDDEILVLRELARGGYRVVHERVDTPVAMAEALQRSTWDLLLSDYSMPSFGAVQALELLHASGLDIPFIVVSGTISEELAVEVLKAGAHDFVGKHKLARLLPAIERELRDATERQRRRLAESERAQSERLLRSVVASVPDGVIVADVEGRFLLWNASADALVRKGPTTRPPSEWPDEYGIYAADGITPHSWEALPLCRAMRGETVDSHIMVIRHSAAADGIWLSVNARPLLDEAGTVHGGVIALRDITHARAAQEQLMMSDRMASVGLLAAGVAHEINNPLAAALLNVDLAAQALADADDGVPVDREGIMADLRAAKEAAARVAQIVRDLNVFSRGEHDRKSRVEIDDVVESAVRLARNEIRHRAHLVREYQPAPAVEANEARLGQVILNLLVNAAQAIPEGRADENQITLALGTTEHGYAFIEVRDTGVGMTPEVIQRVFTPFYTTKAAGSGTGLGLAISHRIVSGLGGEILVDSTIGVGTTFRVILPPCRADVVAEPSTGPIVLSRPSRRGRLLVIDDEPMIGAAIRRLFMQEHDVEITTEAAEGLRRIGAGEFFDLVLCDLMMPVVTGMDVFDAIAEQAPAVLPRLVFLTGGAFTPRARNFLERVSNVRLTKPFDPLVLRALVDRSVG